MRYYSRPTHVACGFLGGSGGTNRGQMSSLQILRELARISSVGLDPIARLAGDQAGSHHLALDPERLELSLQGVAAGACLIAT